MSNNIWWVVFIVVIIAVFLYPVETKEKITGIGDSIKGYANIQTIVENPENYLNKTIIVKGTVLTHVSTDPYHGFGGEYELEDKQGYCLYLIGCSSPGYVETGLGAFYDVTGIIKKADVCVCKRNKTETLANGKLWRELIDDGSMFPQFMPVQSCEKPTESYMSWPPFGSEKNMNVTIDYTCKPNTKTIFYYLKCTGPMVKKF